jgi:hypothetical protein
VEHIEKQPCNEPTLPTRHIPEHPSFWATFRLGYGIIRMRFVRQAPESVNYEASLRLIDRPLLRLLADIGALSAPSLAELVNRDQMIDTRPVHTGIHSMATATARDWLTSAWRRSLVITMPEPPSGCLLEGPLWALTQHGRDRLQSPVAAAVSRFPWLRIVSILVAAGGGIGGGIYTWINAHGNVAGVIFIWLVVAVLYALGLWLVVRLFEAKEAPIGLVAIETHRAQGNLPPLLGAAPA